MGPLEKLTVAHRSTLKPAITSMHGNVSAILRYDDRCGWKVEYSTSLFTPARMHKGSSFCCFRTLTTLVFAMMPSRFCVCDCTTISILIDFFPWTWAWDRKGVTGRTGTHNIRSTLIMTCHSTFPTKQRLVVDYIQSEPSQIFCTYTY